MLPYIHWINTAYRIIRKFCKCLGLKKNQLVDLYEEIDDSISMKDNTRTPENPFEKSTDFSSLSALLLVLE